MTSRSDERIKILSAAETDVPLILSLIKDLAAYEKLSHEVLATESTLKESLFGEKPYAEVAIGYYESIPAGYVLFFHNFSTFTGRPGIYIEDIFVKETFRGKGMGRALFLYIAGLAKDRNCGRIEYSVLTWNEPALNFYKRFGAQCMDDWCLYRISGDSLNHLI
ncbi:MAG TPA: GNAT family N-acetyltransferase [Deltaproteobacteria bacterium]|nr:GNAT family N-acetyltransferase [Deltaproteobacteria bacterium]